MFRFMCENLCDNCACFSWELFRTRKQSLVYFSLLVLQKREIYIVSKKEEEKMVQCRKLVPDPVWFCFIVDVIKTICCFVCVCWYSCFHFYLQQTDLEGETPAATGAGTPTGSVVGAPGPKRLHVSNIPFRFREADLRNLLGVSQILFQIAVALEIRNCKNLLRLADSMYPF